MIVRDMLNDLYMIDDSKQQFVKILGGDALQAPIIYISLHAAIIRATMISVGHGAPPQRAYANAAAPHPSPNATF
jgi:hypothetical protein